MENRKKPKKIGDQLWLCLKKKSEWSPDVEDEGVKTPIASVVEEKVVKTPIASVVEEKVVKTPIASVVEEKVLPSEIGNRKKQKQIGDPLWLCLKKKGEWNQSSEINQDDVLEIPAVVEEEVPKAVGVDGVKPSEISNSPPRKKPKQVGDTLWLCLKKKSEPSQRSETCQQEVLKTPRVEEKVLDTVIVKNVVQEEPLDYDTVIVEDVFENSDEEKVLETPGVEEKVLETPGVEDVVEEEVFETPRVEEKAVETVVVKNVVQEEQFDYDTGTVLVEDVFEDSDEDEDSVEGSDVEDKSRRLTIAECLLYPLAELVKPPAQRQNAEYAAELRILVPWCWDATLPEQLYDAGFLNITSVRDHTSFIKHNSVVREARQRPWIKWLVTDFTAIQLPNEGFDAVVDERLDFLMRSEGDEGKLIANLYLHEAERLLKAGGKYICITGFHALDMLLPRFRFGWEMSLHTFAEDYELKLLVAAVKSDPCTTYDISLNLGECYDVKGQCRVCEAVEKENIIRGQSIYAPCTLQDLIYGARGNMSQLAPGRRINLILGEPGVSRGNMTFLYNCVLLDNEQDPESFIYHYGLYIVPKSRARDEEFTSEEGQWHIVESLKTARLLMVFLDSSNSIYSMEDIYDDLIPFMEHLAPGYVDIGHTNIKFLAARDGSKKKEIVAQYTSLSSGPVVVEDVTYLDISLSNNAYKGRTFRRLIFIRTPNRVQSEALLSRKGSTGKGKTKEQTASSSEMEVVHNYLASQYHIGIISSMLLISSYLNISNPQTKKRKNRNSNSFANPSKVVILGLGAGLLPMFMKTNRPSLEIEVVDSDPYVLTAAKRYFGFKEDELLQVHITDDMIKFFEEIAEDEISCRVDILVVDVNSFDTSSGLTCPPESFVEESFLSAAKRSLSERGLFVMNLISRSPSIRNEVHLRLKKIFNNIFRLKLEEDFNEVLFAFNASVPTEKGQFSGVVKVYGLLRRLELMKL